MDIDADDMNCQRRCCYYCWPEKIGRQMRLYSSSTNEGKVRVSGTDGKNPKPVYRINLDPNEISDFVMNLLGSAMEQKFSPVERQNWLAVKPTRVSVERVDRPETPTILAFECGEVTVNFVIRDPKTLAEALIAHVAAYDTDGQRKSDGEWAG